MIRVTVTHTWRCDECRVEHFEDFAVPRGAEYPRPCLPVGWSEIGGKNYCPGHEVRVWVVNKGSHEVPLLDPPLPRGRGHAPGAAGLHLPEPA